MNKKLKDYSDTQGKNASSTDDFNFKGLDLSEQTHEDMFFNKLNLESANLSKAQFIRCSFDYALLVNANLQGAYFKSCSFKSTDMTAANITQSTTFENCKNFKETMHKQKYSKSGRALTPTEQRAIELRDWKLDNRGFVRNGSKSRFLKIAEAMGKLK